MREYKCITAEDKKLIKQLKIPDHVVFAIDNILKNESMYNAKNKKLENFQDVLLDSLQKRAELYYKYNI